MKLIPPLVRYRHLILVTILTIISLYFDNSFTSHITNLRAEKMNIVMVIVTQLEMIWVLFILLFIPFLLSEKHKSKLFPLWGSIALALFLTHTLKIFFLSERPEIIMLTQETSPGFPSMHTALMFSVIPILLLTYKKLVPVWSVAAFLIAFSRIYVGVHFLSDILGGIVVGLASGEIFVWLEEKRKFSKKIMNIHFELRRQIAHIVIGFTSIIGIQSGLITTRDIGFIFLGGLFLLLAYKKYPDKIPIVTPLLSFFERKKDRLNFPGKGSFFLILGIFLSLVLFSQQIALTAIAILSIGDAVTNIVGRYFGEIENPLNPKKTIEGSLVGFFFSLAIASFFVSFWPAFFASAGAIFVESLRLKVGNLEIDDNVVIPLTAGWILTLWYF